MRLHCRCTNDRPEEDDEGTAQAVPEFADNQAEASDFHLRWSGKPSDGLPGFCVFEPIQHVALYLEWWDKEMKAEQEPNQAGGQQGESPAPS